MIDPTPGFGGISLSYTSVLSTPHFVQYYQNIITFRPDRIISQSFCFIFIKYGSKYGTTFIAHYLLSMPIFKWTFCRNPRWARLWV